MNSLPWTFFNSFWEKVVEISKSIKKSLLLLLDSPITMLLGLMSRCRTPLEWIALGEEESVAAGQLRAEYKMSTADSAIVTQAAAHGCELWHKDPEFDALPKNFVKVKRLPYKKRRKK